MLEVFLSTPSARRATCPVTLRPTSRKDFYPRPPRGGRLVRAIPAALSFPNFYPRPPRGGRLFTTSPSGACTRNFYPRPPRGGRPRGLRHVVALANFYPRPPRGGRRSPDFIALADKRFLSTPSARRATVSSLIFRKNRDISIHALREEGDGILPSY